MARLDIPDYIVAQAHRRWLKNVRSSGQAKPMPDRRIRNLVTQHTPPTRLPKAPNSPPTASASPPKATSAETPLRTPRALPRRLRPKPRKRPKARPPCNTWRRFMGPHLDDPRSIARYDAREHTAVRLTREARLELTPDSAIFLPANNYTARINYATIATAEVTRFTESLPRSMPVFWVTLVRGSYTVPYDDAADLNLFRLQQWVRAEFRGCSFVAMTEPALFTNAGEVKMGWRRAVSWHIHLLVWGISKWRLREIRKSINARFRTFIPGVRAAHYRTLKPGEVEGQTLYMLKAPVNEYRIIPHTRKVVSHATGEVTREATGRFTSKKYPLGPGDLVRMANLLSGKRLDQLAFATGDGKAVLQGINFKALAAERAVVAQERAFDASRRSIAAQLKRSRR